MPKRTNSGMIIQLDLDRRSPVPIHRQVYAGIRQRIIGGVLPIGAELPSTRGLARDLVVSRSTVVLAYEALRSEGYAHGRRGAVPRVAVSLPERSLRAPDSAPTRSSRPYPGRPSRRGKELAALPFSRHLNSEEEAPRPFRTGVPAVDIFPVDVWGRLLARRWGRVQAKYLAYGRTFGFLPLREAICDYLRSARSVRCTPEQIVIVNGSQQGLDLAARTVVDPGDRAWIEEPGYHGARGAFAAAGAQMVPVPVDREGLNVAEGCRLAPDARAAFVTPAHQMPLGVSMSRERRLELFQWARGAEAWIIEDDYASEFRYAGRPLASLHALDPYGCVIYSGTFSKITFPSVRLGYLVIPPALIDTVAAIRSFMDCSPSYLQQAAMADFMIEGHFERHIRRMRTIYKERQEALLEHAGRELTGLLEVQPADGGMTLLGWLAPGISELGAAAAAREHKVEVRPLSFYATLPIRPGLFLGYAGLREAEIREGVLRLRKALEPLAR